MQRHETLRHGRGDREQDQADEPAHQGDCLGRRGRPSPDGGRQARRDERERQREQGQAGAPQDDDHDELEDGQRERDEDVDDVAPAVDVDEHGEEQVPNPGAVGAVRVGQEGSLVGEGRA